MSNARQTSDSHIDFVKVFLVQLQDFIEFWCPS